MRPVHDRLRVAPRPGRPRGDVPDQDAAAQPGQRAAQYQYRGALGEQVLAERVGHEVVVAHGPQRAPVRRLGHPPHQPVGTGRQDQRDDRVGPLISRSRRVVLALQRRGDQRQARGAVEERPVVRHQQVEGDRGDEKADRREIAAQPPADQERERQRGQPADDGGADPRHGEGQVPPAEIGLESAVGRLAGQGQDRRGVGADRLEDDEAEVGDPGHAELLAQAEAGDDVDAGVDQQVEQVIQLRAGHAAAPSRPPGRTAIMTSRTAKAMTSLYDGVM